MNLGNIQWGNVAEWLAAVGTVAALGFSLFLLRNEQKARLVAEEDRRLRYAGGVTALLDHKYLYEGEPGEEYLADEHWNAIVHNAGDTPVYECFLLVGPARHDPPHDFIVLNIGTVAPEAKQTEFVHSGWLKADQDPFIWAYFRDSTGRTWIRNDRGRLVDLASDEAVSRRVAETVHASRTST